MKIFMVFMEKKHFLFLFYCFHALISPSDVITDVKQNCRQTKQKHYDLDIECLLQSERRTGISANQNNFDTRAQLFKANDVVN